MQAVSSPVTNSPTRFVLWGNLISVYILWGSTYLFIHFMTEQMPPLYMVSMRYLVAGALLYGYARLTGTPLLHETNGNQQASLVYYYSLFQTVVYQQDYNIFRVAWQPY